MEWWSVMYVFDLYKKLDWMEKLFALNVKSFATLQSLGPERKDSRVYIEAKNSQRRPLHFP